MTDGMANGIFHHKINQSQPDNWKQKVECMVIVLYQVAFKNMLNKMRQVFEDYRTNPRSKPNKDAQQHHELFVGDVLGSPDQKTF